MMPGKANVTNQAWYVMKRTRWRVEGPDGSLSGPAQVAWSPLLYFQLLGKGGWNIADISVTKRED